MGRRRFEKKSEIHGAAREVFDWHARDGAFERLVPPWQRLKIISQDPGVDEGKRIDLRMGMPAGSVRWLAVHTSCIEGKEFTDTQEKGPFKAWTHRHSFEDTREFYSELSDEIEYELPLGAAGTVVGGPFAASQLERTFSYRHWITKEDFELKRSLPHFRSLRIAIAGGSGFLGTQLKALLTTQGHEVRIITRKKRSQSDIRWDPQKGEIEISELEGLDAVINLAGANLTSGRWNEARKQCLWSSRIDATRFLVDAFLRLEEPPEIFLSGSATGYYGSDPDAVFDEDSKRGGGFLAELCAHWESAALRAESAGMRVCLLRTGLVLDPRGGALQKMLPAFRIGAGGPLGSGKQWFPWVSLEDWIRAVNWLLFAERIRGPVNLVSPQSLRQEEFAAALGNVLNRPMFLPVPKFALKLALGEMADEALLASTQAVPSQLAASGYRFCQAELSDALRLML